MVKTRYRTASTLVTFLVLVGLLVAACGSKQSTTDPTTQTPAPTVATEVPKATTPSPDPATPPKLTKLSVGLSAVTTVGVPLWIAKEQGIFAKYGLDVDVVVLTAGSAITRTIVTGDTPIGILSTGSVIDARLEGTDLKVIASGFDRYYLYVWGKKEIKSPNDLKGKTIAATKPNSATDYAVRDFMSSLGFTKDKDYKVAYAGDGKAQLASLIQGVVDAAVFSPPRGLSAKEGGMVQVATLYDREDLAFGYGSVVTSEKWAKANPDLTEAFLKAYVEGIQVAKRDKALTKKLIGKYMDLTDDASLEEAYQTFVPFLPDKPYVSEVTIKATLSGSVHPKSKGADPKEFIDNSFVQALENKGFFKEVLK